MNLLNIINTTVVTIGLPTIIIASIYVGKKLQVLSSIDTCVDKMKDNLTVISAYLTRNHNKFNPSELKTLSPYQLTPEGNAFIRSLGFHNVFNDQKSDFFGFIDNENVRLKYDVEAAAIKSVYALYEKPYLEFIKVYFYNNPERNLENTAPTLGVYIRDEYLFAHPEITQ